MQNTKKTKKNYTPTGTNHLFYLGVPARRRVSSHAQTNTAAAPSGFTLQWLASSENGICQLLPLSKSPTLRKRIPASHFRCNPSRILVEIHTRFAARHPAPSSHTSPCRDCPAHVITHVDTPSPHIACGVIEKCSLREPLAIGR